jgi:cation-transporting P-type ATPase C
MPIAVNAPGLVVGAAGGLSPVLAAILHNASSVAVVANSSRLIRYRLAAAEQPNSRAVQEHSQRADPQNRVRVSGLAG